MRSSYTLVVIDMQDVFAASQQEHVIQACQREIKRAIADEIPILFVEYGNYYKHNDPIDERLTDLILDYDLVYWATKYHDDGSAPILKVISENQLPYDLRVCGVNTNICVYDTVTSLNRLLPHYSPQSEIVVVADACNALLLAGHQFALNQMSYLTNVRIED